VTDNLAKWSSPLQTVDHSSALSGSKLRMSGLIYPQ